MMIRLSIIVPLYKSETYLPKCLNSLLNQDIPYDDYEIILVNDGSPDGSKALAEDYALKYPNIVVLTQNNKGTSGARNAGLRFATGKYVYFVDPDDYILENSLNGIIHKMEEESLDVLRFGYTEVDENYQPTKSCKHPEQPDYSSILMDGYTFMGERLGVACYVWTYLFRLSLIKDNDIYFIEGDYFDDTPWLPKVLSLARRVDSIDWKRHFYLIRSNSLVQSSSNKSIKRKIEGYWFLIRELQGQMKMEHNSGALKWYKMMISHCVLTSLTLVGLYCFNDRQKHLNYLKNNNVYPLPHCDESLSNKVKVSLINLSPELFCRLIHTLRHRYDT